MQQIIEIHKKHKQENKESPQAENDVTAINTEKDDNLPSPEEMTEEWLDFMYNKILQKFSYSSDYLQKALNIKCLIRTFR